jgi:hypothetical protein
MRSSIFWDTRPCNIWDSHSGCYEEFCLLECNAVWALLGICFTLISYLAYSSALNLEATSSTETSEDFQRSTRRYISEDITLQYVYNSEYLYFNFASSSSQFFYSISLFSMVVDFIINRGNIISHVTKIKLPNAVYGDYCLLLRDPFLQRQYTYVLSFRGATYY